MVSSPPEASIGRMIKPFGMRKIQISSSNLPNAPMLDYTCGQHALIKSEKMAKNVDFYPKK